MDNRFECGCERGGDCTKTTMCQLQDALEDKDAEIERLECSLVISRGKHQNAIDEIERMKPVIDAAQELINDGCFPTHDDRTRQLIGKLRQALDRSKEQ